MFGYRRELDKYEDVDEDELLASLTADELRELEHELADIDPDRHVPVGLRQKDQTAKTPTGTFSREALMKYWEDETRKLLEDERTGCSLKPEDERKEDGIKEEDSDTEECVTEDNSEASEEEGSMEDEEEDEEDSEVEEEEAVTENEEEDEGAVREESRSESRARETHGLGLRDREEQLPKPDIPVNPEGLNIKITPDRPCGNPTVIDETLEKIQADDADLTEVNLNNIENISQQTLVRFADALRSNTHVRVFSLANTRADDQVAFAIAQMLQTNSSITNLNIESNFVTGRGVLALARALQRNHTLTELRFHNQRHILGGQAEMELVKLLRDNTTLLKLGYQFDLPGPRMSMTGILTRNQDQLRKQRLQEQRQQCAPDGPANPRTAALQKGTPTASPYGSPRPSPWSSPWSSPKLPRQDVAKKAPPPVAVAPPPPPPPPPPLPPPPPPSKCPPEKAVPTRNIAEVIRQQEKQKQRGGANKPKARKGKKGGGKEKESSILKELKSALRPVADRRSEEASRPSTPQRSAHDDLMTAIRSSSIKSLRRVEIPPYLR